MYYLVAPMQVIAGYATKAEAEAEKTRRSKTDARRNFFCVLEASNENEARARAKKFYEELESRTGQAWKN